jgi:sigma-E factor negative regulatory protein RseA
MTDVSQRDAEQLSSLVDGELDAADVERACSRWRSGDGSQATWHAYHLIGDVLRSEDLAGSPGHDQRALAQLRRRLADEPAHGVPESVVRVPELRVAAVRRRRNWGALAAVAAGFAAVTGTLVVLRSPVAADATGAGQAAAPALAAPTAVAAAVRSLDRDQLVLAADGKLVRDTRLDRYLDAHKHFSGSSALGLPSSFLRGATSDASNR